MAELRTQAMRASATRVQFLKSIMRYLETPAMSARKAVQQVVATSPSGGSLQGPEAALTQHMETLVARLDNLGEIIHLGSGLVAPNTTEFHFGDAIRQAGERAQPGVAAAGQQMLVYVAPGIDRPFQGNAPMLGKVLDLLLDTARQRTPSGGSLQLRAQPEAQGVLIDLMDTGNALPPHQQRLLQSDEPMGDPDSNTDSNTDTGIDERNATDPELEIRLRLIAGRIKAMGGRLSVQTKPEHGTSVHVWLPLHREHPAPPEAHPVKRPLSGEQP